ncbi:MAG: hypothetical protein ACFFAH_13075 [Promethearchaeota archaeon]
MKFRESLDFNEFIGHHTLLYGETDTKKTYYTARFVQFLLNVKKFNPKDISILDFAPKLFKYYGIRIGGKIEDYYPQSLKCNNITFKGEIIPPRLRASNKKELYDNACKNYKKTNEILKFYHENPTPVLIINDISIYLHLGSKKFLLETIRKADTFFGNAYYGSSIERSFASLFSLKEKGLIKYLIRNVDNAYITEK